MISKISVIALVFFFKGGDSQRDRSWDERDSRRSWDERGRDRERSFQDDFSSNGRPRERSRERSSRLVECIHSDKKLNRSHTIK